MPEEEVFRFWCLIEGEKVPFAVDANFKWNVFQLKEAIQQKRPVLRDRDITELVLLKLNSPPVSVDNEIHLPFPITNSVKLDKPSRKVSEVFPCPLEDHLHFVIQVPPAAREVARAPMLRIPTEDREWSVYGAVRRLTNYHVDPAEQAENRTCLEHIRKGDLCLLTGSRASGKTTRLFRIRNQLAEAGIWNIYVSLHGLNLNDPTSFWESFGWAVSGAARKRNIPFPELTISSSNDFLRAFHVTKWSRNLVLLLDEFSVLHHASEAKSKTIMEYAVFSVLVAGTFSAVHLNPTDRSLSPFNVATRVQNPNFTLDETKSLFRQFMEDACIIIDDDVIEDVWVRTGGHPGMVCLCGHTISENLGSLMHHGTLSYQSWLDFPDMKLYEAIAAYNTFGSMIVSLDRPDAEDAVRLLRSKFLGYFGNVELPHYREQRLADFLTAEGVLFKSGRSPIYHMTSPLVDGLLRRTVILNLFPNAPKTNPPLDGSIQSLDFLQALRESLKCFDKEHIRLAEFSSYKLSKTIKVAGIRNAQVPRESVYDTELMRILTNWLQMCHGWSVTGQQHLKTPFGKHVVLKKEGYPTILVEVVVTGEDAFISSHVDKTPEYMELLRAQKAWVVHFTREDDFVPVWQSEDILNEGVNMVHIWHNAEFTNLKLMAKWKDSAGIRHLDTHWQTVFL